MSDQITDLKRKYREKLVIYYKTLCEEYEENPEMFLTEEVTPQVENIRAMIDQCRRPSPEEDEENIDRQGTSATLRIS